MDGLTPADAAALVDGRTLYVTVPGSSVSARSGRIVVKTPADVKMNVPRGLIERVVTVGAVGITGAARAALLRAGVEMIHLSRRGKLLGVTLPARQGGGALRRAQYRVADARSPEPVRALILDKISNQRALLRRYVHPSATLLAKPLAKAAAASTIDELMGAEGWAARTYFEALGSIVDVDGYNGTRTRPATDPVNAALNFGYALLVGDSKAAVYSAGLDPAVGLLHRDRGRRPAASLDICEPYRAPIVDAAILDGFRRRRLRPEEFTTGANGSTRLGASMRRALCDAYERRMRTDVTFNGERRSWRAWMHVTARDVAASLRAGRPLESRRWR